MNGLYLNTVEEGTIFINDDKLTYLKRSLNGRLSKLELALRDVVRVTVYLADIGDFDAMNRVYSAVFQAPYPARSTVQVRMPFGALVGVEVTAFRSRKDSALESTQRDIA
jgi:hypothetical protein